MLVKNHMEYYEWRKIRFLAVSFAKAGTGQSTPYTIFMELVGSQITGEKKVRKAGSGLAFRF